MYTTLIAVTFKAGWSTSSLTCLWKSYHVSTSINLKVGF